MKKQLHYFISSIMLLMLTTGFYNNAIAQVAHTESFDGVQLPPFPPPGWTAVGPINDWSRQTNGANPTCMPHSGVGMARFNRNAQPNTLQTFSSPMVDYSNRGVDTPRVSFWIFRDGGAPTVADIITIFVNTTPVLAGATSLGTVARSRSISLPDTQAVNGWYQYTYDIPSSFGTATNYILIRGANDVNQGNNIFIDDIQYDAYPTPCTGSPTPGIIVPTDTMICGGGGSTMLSLNGQATDTGIAIQWNSAPSDTGPWTNFANSVSSISTGNITVTTYYYAVLTCGNSGLSDSTPVVHVTVDPNPPPVVSVTGSNIGIYCLGGLPDTLIATGALTYTWSPATGLDTTAGDTVYASPAGPAGGTILYTVTGTNASGCKGVDSIVVTRHTTSTPALQVTPNDTVCSGQQLTLNMLPSFMQPAITDYLWTPGNETTQSITLFPGVDSTYTVHVINTWGCPYSDSVRIHVATGSVPTITSLTADPFNGSYGLYCAGGPPVILQVTGTGAVTYAWTPPNGLNTTSGDSVLSAPTGGFGGANILYTVTLTSAAGCATSDTIRVRRFNPPGVNLNVTNDSICAGDSTTLNAMVFGFNDTFLWTPGGDTSQTITVAPIINQIYNVHVVSGTSGCPRDTAVEIIVSPAPFAAFTYTITPGTRTVTFHNNSANGLNYEWHFGDGNLSQIFNAVYTYPTNGPFNVSLIVSNGNCTPDTAFTTVVFTVGIEEINSADFISISPNPTGNISIIEFRADDNVLLQVINSIGEVVSERTINSKGSSIHRETIDMSKFPAGVYMIQIHSGGKSVSRKLIRL